MLPLFKKSTNTGRYRLILLDLKIDDFFLVLYRYSLPMFGIWSEINFCDLWNRIPISVYQKTVLRIRDILARIRFRTLLFPH
jgi:hypothetical protein